MLKINLQHAPRLAVKLAAVAASLLMTSTAVNAADAASTWPTKPVTLMVPYAGGGGTDILARLVGSKLAEIWGQSVIVENKAGANGVIGSAEIARSAPDGYKVMLVVGSHVINPILTKTVPFDSLKDFTPITLLAASPMVLVVQKDGKFPNLETFIKKGKEASITVGYSEGATQLTGELIRQKAGIKVVPVPYKGGSPLMIDIIGGHVDSGVTSVLTALPHVKSGKLDVIGTTADKRLEMYPNGETFKQAGYPEVEALSWYGLFGPKGMPEEVVRKFHESLVKATQDPAIAKQLAEQGATIYLNSQADFIKFLEGEKIKWANVAKAGNIQPE
jgi:tripartite-type tricarboxylate transporter receptor subunit TctC